jgi:hypothetical protein
MVKKRVCAPLGMKLTALTTRAQPEFFIGGLTDPEAIYNLILILKIML